MAFSSRKIKRYPIIPHLHPKRQPSPTAGGGGTNASRKAQPPAVSNTSRKARQSYQRPRTGAYQDAYETAGGWPAAGSRYRGVWGYLFPHNL
ncbi:MAG: hypothetical protein LBD24_00985 [Spirochaetaceae bacterium]|nr:hypothetical protein [Spirochaetaceae bacterium]